MSFAKYDAQVEAMITKAREAALEAGLAIKPNTVVFVNRQTGKRFVDDEGACGFGYIQFGKRQQKLFNAFKRLNNKAHPDTTRRGGYSMYGDHDDYRGGWYMCPHGEVANMQSVDRKEAYVKRFVEVINEIDPSINVSYYTRLD